MAKHHPWQLYLTSIGYLLVFGIPAVPLVSVWLGIKTHHPNLFSLLPLLVFYGIVPLLEYWFPYGVPSAPEELSRSKGWSYYYRGLLWLCLPVQLAMLYCALNIWGSGLLNPWSSLIYLVSLGMYSGMFAITVAHELIHHQQRLDRALGGLLLSTVGFGTFKLVHLRIHHRYVGTSLDFATAQRGQSIYSFWWQSLMGNWSEAVRCDRQDRAKTNQPFWKSELLLWSLCSLLWLTLAIAIGGWQGALFWGCQAIIGILQLDLINYLQHYGLTRQQDATGRHEPVQVHHAWSVGLFLHDLVLINLLRHGDHHANPQRTYPTLRHDHQSGNDSQNIIPEYPYNYSIMYLLALVPPLFQRVVHPQLDHLNSLQTQPSPNQVLAQSPLSTPHPSQGRA